MFEMDILTAVAVFFIGLIVGVLVVLLFNRLRTGSASAYKLKAEKDNYQLQVEVHFAETSKKFQQMTEQYQDLYQHMASGAAELCRPENQADSLADLRPNASLTGPEKKVVGSKPNSPEPKKVNNPEPKKVARPKSNKPGKPS
jgi:uncharacterized membrane-anchored protein YhcB (DUF1043 family)